MSKRLQGRRSIITGAGGGIGLAYARRFLDEGAFVTIAEIGDEPADTKIYRIQFDGTLRDIKGYGAMGGMEDELTERLQEALNGLPDLSAAVQLAASSIESVLEAAIADEDWEAAVLDRNLGRRKFRRLDAAEEQRPGFSEVFLNVRAAEAGGEITEKFLRYKDRGRRIAACFVRGGARGPLGLITALATR